MEASVKIVQLQTIQLPDHPYLVIVQVVTDAGYIGVSDTYYAPTAIASYIHDVAGPVLIGADPFRIEKHWRTLNTRGFARWGAYGGAELRALAALDCALWDIKGQALGVPVYELLGGLVQDRIPTYNTCSGPLYGRNGGNPLGNSGDDPLDDLWKQFNDPARLAEELLQEGIRGMKIWPYDRFAAATDGHRISSSDLARGADAFRLIRDAVGDEMEIMLEGHGYWDLEPAKRIAAELEQYRPAWLEDLVLAGNIDSLAELSASTITPVIASEMLSTREQYREVMERRAANLIKIDPTWAGGITESRKIVTLAESFGYSVSMHDCTGPFTMLAGIHLALSAPNALYQETVRAYLKTWFADMTTEHITITDGFIEPPQTPGIGAALAPSFLQRSDLLIRTSEA